MTRIEFWQKWKSGGFNGQRLGQAFCNTYPFFTQDEFDLYYERDETRAKAAINTLFDAWQM